MTRPFAILNDTTRCTGCEQCVAACKQANSLGPDLPRPWKARIDDLSSTRFTTLVHTGDRHIRQLCRHCLEPACVSACIVGALQKSDLGPITYDPGKCMGCRYCMLACPFEIPRYSWEETVPYIRKCDLCADRLRRGFEPACVEACPYEATRFGTREELLREAHDRIRSNPSRYIGRVFGESVIGGTSILYISDVDIGFLAARSDLPDTPLPELTWAALSKVPPMAAAVGGGLTLLWWVIQRRNLLQGTQGGNDEQ